MIVMMYQRYKILRGIIFDNVGPFPALAIDRFIEFVAMAVMS